MKLFYTLIVILIFIASCSKKDATCNYNDSATIAPATEIQQLQDSLNAHGITATQHPSGFFYKINSAGSGASVSNLCTNLVVTYKGTLFNGNGFDSTQANQTASFQLGQLIVAWQKGIPLVSKGGDIDLYVPPSLGFGDVPQTNGSVVVIPAKSYIVFNVHIVDIQ